MEFPRYLHHIKVNTRGEGLTCTVSEKQARGHLKIQKVALGWCCAQEACSWSSQTQPRCHSPRPRGLSPVKLQTRPAHCSCRTGQEHALPDPSPPLLPQLCPTAEMLRCQPQPPQELLLRGSGALSTAETEQQRDILFITLKKET